MSAVTETPVASPAEIRARYAERLRFETDCWDVHHAMATGRMDWVPIDSELLKRLYIFGTLASINTAPPSITLGAPRRCTSRRWRSLVHRNGSTA